MNAAPTQQLPEAMSSSAPCCCSCKSKPPAPPRRGRTARAWVLAGTGLSAWALVIRGWKLSRAGWRIRRWACRGQPAGAAVEFFAYDAPKILLLLTLVSFGVGVLRSFLNPARMRALLAGGGRSRAMCWQRGWAC